MGANEIHTQPIIHTHSFKLTQMVHTHSARFARAPLALRARPTHALRLRFALASLALAASHRRQMPPSSRLRSGGISRHHPTHSGCSLLGGQQFYKIYGRVCCEG